MTVAAADPAAVIPSARVVGNAFVHQYYYVLSNSPEIAYKFYGDSSVLSRPNSDGKMTSVSTLQGINEKIQSLDSKNYNPEIKTVDAQESYQTGVIVVVTGSLTGTDGVKRKFTQTFFLAPQENGYFVLNDVLRFVEESEQLEMQSKSVNCNSGGFHTTPISEPTHVLPNPAHSTATPKCEDSQDPRNEEEVNNPLTNGKPSVLVDEVVNEPPAPSWNDMMAPSSTNSSKAQQETKSYASIVKVPKAAASNTSVHSPTSIMRWVPTKTSPDTLHLAKPSREPAASAPTSDIKPESSNAYEEVEGYSIYIRNLPRNTPAIQIEKEFAKFGPIKRGGVQVRLHKEQGYCFGFVKFLSLDSMQKAIKESPIRIGAHQVVVEQKRSTFRVVSSGNGNYTTRRGEFQSNNHQVRAYVGDRGYGRSDFRKQRDITSRPMSNSGRNTESSYLRVVRNGHGRYSSQAGVNKIRV